MDLRVAAGSHHSLMSLLRGNFLNIKTPSQIFISRRSRLIAVAVLALAILAVAASLKAQAVSGQNGVEGQNNVPVASSSAKSDSEAVEQANNSGSNSSAGVSNSSSLNINLHSSSSTVNGSTNSSASLKVNGQNVPVDSPNSIHQTYTSADGSSHVSISVDNGGGM